MARELVRILIKVYKEEEPIGECYAIACKVLRLISGEMEDDVVANFSISDFFPVDDFLVRGRGPQKWWIAVDGYLPEPVIDQTGSHIEETEDLLVGFFPSRRFFQGIIGEC